MLALGFDTETTDKVDFHAPSNAEHQPDLVQLACCLYDMDTIYSAVNLLIVPSLDISPKAFEAHGFSKELCSRVGISRRGALSIFHQLLKKADIIVAHNLNFDVRVMATAYAREDIDGSLLLKPKQFCTMLNTTNVCKIKGQLPGKYKWPTLQEAYIHLVDPGGFKGAHNAMNDVMACIAVHRSMMKQNLAA